MRRRVKEEEVEKKPRDRRIIVYVNQENLQRWRHSFLDMGVKNYEEALMLLLDVYEILSKQFGTKNLKEIIKKLNEFVSIVRVK